eukprot:gb/GFBE01023015.1/.p1 GENE.gb/GFBE01023015.1/~~gb/GFBE01023015.1/.p1  ORF type:complete len:310 (+),score=78.93 gb/GFBE01023015.1/:1-930(+)
MSRQGEQEDFEKLEASVIRWLLARNDVQDIVRLAQSGKQDEAASALLGTVKGLLAAQPQNATAVAAPKAKVSIAKRQARPRPKGAEEPAAKRPCSGSALAGEYWLETCTRAVEAERLESEERSRAKRAAAGREAPASQTPQRSSDKPLPLFWRVDVPEVTKVLTQRGVLPSSFLPVVRPHVTLLYMGGDLPEERAASRAGLSITQFRSAKMALERLKGKQVTVKMTEIIIEENVACAVVSLPADVPCGGKVPHITLGTRYGVPARHANDVLEEVKAGRKEGVTRIQLPKAKELKGVLDLETSATYAEKS